MEESLLGTAKNTVQTVRASIRDFEHRFDTNPFWRSTQTGIASYRSRVGDGFPGQLSSALGHLATVLRRTTSSFALPTWILPSFVSDHLSPKARSKTASGNKISALDGLRGLCCLMVIHMHWTFAVTDSNEGGSWESNVNFLFHRPFFYLLWAGTSHVFIFFVMSGYVLSVKCLSMIHQGMPAHRLIASAIFRRAARIFLPPLALLFIYLVAIRAHVFAKSTAIRELNENTHAIQIRLFESTPPFLPTFSEQFWDVLGAAERLVDPTTHFDLPDYGKYDTHLWTMPTEFYCSVTLFVVLLATCQLWTRYRIVLHCSLFAWCWLTSHQNHGLFFAGLIIAEFDIILRRRSRPAQVLPSSSSALPQTPVSLRPTSSTLLSTYCRASNIIATLACLIGLYLLSMPLLWSDETPGYRGLLLYMPAYMNSGQQGDALRALGAVLTVWPITYTCATSRDASSTPLINLILSNPISSYLGQTSFALYLVHGFVIRSLGYSILPSLYDLVIGNGQRRSDLASKQYYTDEIAPQLAPPVSRMTAREIGTIWVAGYLIVLPACVWMADLFHRYIDLKCVALGRWVEEKMVMKEEAAMMNESTVEKVS